VNGIGDGNVLFGDGERMVVKCMGMRMGMEWDGKKITGTG